MMKKTTLREIRESLGRYLAIMAIVALGVGLFAGLKITKTVMVGSADAFWQAQQLYDYRLVSTLGFEEEDVQALAQKADVRAVQGAMEADVLYTDEQGNDKVLKAHSILENINMLETVAGRLPESDTECVVDDHLYGEEVIGSKIVLSGDNDQDDLDSFRYTEYTIVGTVRSPLYVQFERGTTSLGNGSVSGFVYLLPEGFATDYYTDIYVKFEEDAQVYSDEYDAYMDEREAQWETYCEEQGERRYQSIMTEAEEELADAEQELADEKAEAEVELADAKQELTDAEKEIADGEKKLEDGEQELADNKEIIAQKEQELADARAALEAQEAELASQEEALAGMMQGQAAGMQYQMPADMARQQLEAGKAQIEEGEAELRKARGQIRDAGEEIEESRQELADARQEVEDGWQEYNDAKAEFDEKIADAEQKLADARAEIADIEKPDTYVLGRETNTGYVCFESDSSIVEGIANVFPVFFFLVAALVCMTTMNRMVEEQRTQIGVLKALGYGEARIMGKYLFYSGSAAFTGCVAGYLAGIRLFPLVIWQAYGMMYRFDGIVYAFDWATAVLCLAASLLCSMGTTWASCRHELREVAAELMRPKSPKAGKRIFLEWIPFIWNRMKFLHKVSVRNIIRYKRRFLMMVIGISGCTALLLTGFAIRDSVTTVADRQFEEIQTYAVGVTLKDGVTKEDLSLLEELDQIVADNGGDYGLAVETSMDLETADGIKSVKLIAAAEPESFGAYFDLHTPAGEPIAYPQAGEVVICNKLSERYRIRAGDTITLFNEDREELQAVVSGVCENYIYNYVYVNEETYRKATGETGYQSAYVNLPEEADVYVVGAALMKAEHVTAVAVNRDMLLRVSRMMTSMNYIVFVIIACAGALAFIVLYNLNNINITERIREIATIKVLGFYKKETATYVFRENTVLTGIGCAVGLVLGRLLHIYVMHEVDIDMMSFDVHVEPVSYLLSILLTFVFTWLINRIMSGKLDKINMAESLKSVD
ncbi:MAG: FtsX-like permease family protein [Lachnospiraceae bacterium]|nr:FtsX-like permease family protein [Lachnospiraceae bacterium]